MLSEGLKIELAGTLLYKSYPTKDSVFQLQSWLERLVLVNSGCEYATADEKYTI